MPSRLPRPLRRSWHGPAAVALLSSLVITLTRASTLEGDTGKAVPANHRHGSRASKIAIVGSTAAAVERPAPDPLPDAQLVPNSTGVGPARRWVDLATVSAVEGGRAVEDLQDLSNYIPPIFRRTYFVETKRGTLKVRARMFN